MIAVIPKWKVTVRFENRPDVAIWISETHIANVLRTVAGMQFTETGLEQPQSFTVEVVPAPSSFVTASMDSGRYEVK